MKPKTIHRTRRSRNYTPLPNELLRTKSLSFRARGILAMMLSHSEEWRMSLKGLPEFSATEGKDAIRSALKELEAAGYAVCTKLAAQNGQFQGYLWTWHDTPVPIGNRSKPRVGKTDAGLPDDGLADAGKPDALRRTIIEEDNKKEIKVLSKEVRGRGYAPDSLAGLPDQTW